MASVVVESCWRAREGERPRFSELVVALGRVRGEPGRQEEKKRESEQRSGGLGGSEMIRKP